MWSGRKRSPHLKVLGFPKTNNLDCHAASLLAVRRKHPEMLAEIDQSRPLVMQPHADAAARLQRQFGDSGRRGGCKLVGILHLNDVDRASVTVTFTSIAHRRDRSPLDYVANVRETDAG